MKTTQVATNFEVVLGTLDGGTWVAASTASPFFCFEGKTEVEVRECVERALIFYKAFKERVPPFRPQAAPVSVHQLVPSQVWKPLELAVA